MDLLSHPWLVLSILLAALICFSTGVIVGALFTHTTRGNSRTHARSASAEPRFTLKAKNKPNYDQSTNVEALDAYLDSAVASNGDSTLVNHELRGVYAHLRSDAIRAGLERISVENEFTAVADTAREELFFLLGVITEGASTTTATATTAATAGVAERSVSWQHVYSNDFNHFWVSNSTRNGIIMRGHSFAESSPRCIMNWLLEQDLLTGIEGLGRRIEIKRRVVSKKEFIIERKLLCKSGSSSLMSSKRDFRLITSISLQEDGSFVIATRSNLEDILRISTSSRSGSNSNNISSNNSSSSKGGTADGTRGYVRGVVYGSGYILTPVYEEQDTEEIGEIGATTAAASGEQVPSEACDQAANNSCSTATTAATYSHSSSSSSTAISASNDATATGERRGKVVGCDISFVCHMDMMGAGTGRGNTSTTNIILSSVLRTLQQLQRGCANSSSSNNNSSCTSLPTASSFGQLDSSISLAAASNDSETLGAMQQQQQQQRLLKRADSMDSNVSVDAQDSSDVKLSNDLIDQLLQMAKGATLKLRYLCSQLNVQLQLQQSAAKNPADVIDDNPLVRMASDINGTASSSNSNSSSSSIKESASIAASANGDSVVAWELFYEQSGISLYELSRDPASPIGVLAATCHINAPYQDVCSLLADRPDAVDHFLEGRSVLRNISADTYIQWMAYGAIYPITARDFLLVTSKEAYHVEDGTGFILASTSIDEHCEIAEIARDTSSSNNSSNNSSCSNNINSSNSNSNSNSSSNGGVEQGAGGSLQSRYSRSQLRLAGYVGRPNADNTTTLTFLLDMKIHHGTPAWLLQILAQYGLTEMMITIRSAFEQSQQQQEQQPQQQQQQQQQQHRPRSWKNEKSNAAATVAALASSAMDSSHAPAAQENSALRLFFGDRNSNKSSSNSSSSSDRAADISKMIANIQAREERMAYRRNTAERVARLSPSKISADGSPTHTYSNSNSNSRMLITAIDNCATPETPDSEQQSPSTTATGVAAVASSNAGTPISRVQALQSATIGHRPPLSPHVDAGFEGFNSFSEKPMKPRDRSGSYDQQQQQQLSSLMQPVKVERAVSNQETGRQHIHQYDVAASFNNSNNNSSNSNKKRTSRISLGVRRNKDPTQLQLQQRDSPLALPDSDAEVAAAATGSSHSRFSRFRSLSKSSNSSPRIATPVEGTATAATTAPASTAAVAATSRKLGIFSNSPRESHSGRFSFRRTRSNSNERSASSDKETTAATAVAAASPMRLPRARTAFGGRQKEEVDCNAIFRELSKISPARRPDPQFADAPPRSVLSGRSYRRNSSNSSSNSNSQEGQQLLPGPLWMPIIGVATAAAGVAATATTAAASIAGVATGAAAFRLDTSTRRRSLSPVVAASDSGADSSSDRERFSSCDGHIAFRRGSFGHDSSADEAIESADYALNYSSPDVITASAGIAAASSRRHSSNNSSNSSFPLCTGAPHRTVSEGSSLQQLSLANDKRGTSEQYPISPVGMQGYDEAWRYYFQYLGHIPGAENTSSSLCRLSPETRVLLDWQLKVCNKSNTNIYSSTVGASSWNAIKAVTVMNTTPKVLLSLLLDDSRMAEYDNMFDYAQPLSTVNEKTRIRRLCFKEIWPTAPRDFVVLTSWKELPNGAVMITSRSVAHDRCPPQKGYVRGFLQLSAYLLIPYSATVREQEQEQEQFVGLLEDVPTGAVKKGLQMGQTKVTLINHTELGGSLPSSVINMLSTAAPVKILSTINDLCT